MRLTTKRVRQAAGLLGLPLLLVGLAGCSLFDDAKPPLKGERIAVLSGERTIETDSRLANEPVRLPRPQRNPEWPQQGGYPDHALNHLEISATPSQVWSTRIGAGSGSGSFLLAQPVVAGGRILTIDADSVVRASDARDGRVLWSKDLKPEDADSPIESGGVAVYGDRVFAATGHAQVVAMALADGKELWRQNLPAPARAAPTIMGDRVFAVSADNFTQTFAVSDGHKLWNHQGISESAGLIGGASPATDGSIVIIPYSSGELFALRTDTGRVAWGDSLAAIRRQDAVSALADIRARPVLDRGTVYAVSHSGRMAALDVRSGARLWETDFGGTEPPWLAGDWLYLITGTQELLCLDRKSGRVRWSTPLPRWENPDDRTDPILWSGPVLGSDRLIVVGSTAEALSVSPYTGQVLGSQKLPGPTSITPVIADGTLYVLTDDGTLAAYR